MATPENDKSPGGSAPEGSGADKVVAKAAAKVAEGPGAGAHTPKRPVGRPPKAKPESEAGAGPGAGGNNLPPFDPGVVKSCVESLLRTTDRFIVRKVYSTAFELTANQKRSEAIAADVALTPEEAKMMPELAEVCAKQYGLLGQHAPAIFLGVFVCGYAARSLYALSQLREIAELNAAAQAKASTAAPTPEKILKMPTDADKPQSVQTPSGGN